MSSAGDSGVAEAAGTPTYRQVRAELVRPRGGMPNVLAKLEAGGPVRVAYFGGSITAAGKGWREKTLSWLRQRFSRAEVSQINAAIGGTGSDLGVFRMQRDVLDHRPDLIFVEFAVNDGGRDPVSIWRAMEGICRKAWRQDPVTDLCFVYTIHTAGMPNDYRKGMCPRSTSSMELLADHYGIPSIDLGLRVVRLAEQGRLVYKSDEPSDEVISFARDDCHPSEAGHKVYAELVADAIEGMAGVGERGGHRLPEAFIEKNQESAQMVPPTRDMLSPGWRKLGPEHGLARAFRGRMSEMWEAGRPGERLAFRFRGSEAWLYDILGPDGGQVVVTVDGRRRGPVPRFDSYCSYHRLASLFLAAGLDEGAVHSVVVEIHPEQPDRSSVVDVEKVRPGFDPKKYDGHAVRVGAIMLVGEIVEWRARAAPRGSTGGRPVELASGQPPPRGTSRRPSLPPVPPRTAAPGRRGRSSADAARPAHPRTRRRLAKDHARLERRVQSARVAVPAGSTLLLQRRQQGRGGSPPVEQRLGRGQRSSGYGSRTPRRNPAGRAPRPARAPSWSRSRRARRTCAGTRPPRSRSCARRRDRPPPSI